MAVAKTIPKDSRFIQTLNLFNAAFNVPALGQYSFNVAANRGVQIFPITKTSVFLIERYSFSCNIPEGVYLENIAALPVFRLRRQSDGLVIYKRALPCVNYIDGQEAIVYYNSDNENDFLIADFEGILNQSAPLVGVPVVTAQITLNLYEIVESNWIRKYRLRSPEHAVAVDMNQ